MIEGSPKDDPEISRLSDNQRSKKASPAADWLFIYALARILLTGVDLEYPLLTQRAAGVSLSVVFPLKFITLFIIRLYNLINLSWWKTND